MKSIRLLLSTGVLLYAVNLSAQSIPDPSPKSTVIQKFGLGEVKLEYSRPSANGRTLWGSLVPYGEVWRTGANYPTFLTFSDTVWIEGNKISPGKYALYTIPDRDEWTIILSANTKLWGAYGYTDSADIMRGKVKPIQVKYVETFTINFSDIKDDEMVLNLSWGELSVPIKIKVDIAERVVASFKEKLQSPTEDAGAYWKGAEYLRKHNRDMELALMWATKAVEKEEYWGYIWTKAQIYAQMGNYKEALIWGNKALAVGRENKQYFTYEYSYMEQIREWEKK